MTLYQVWKNQLLLTQRGEPFKTYSALLSVARSWGVKRNKSGEYIIPDKLIKEHNQRIEKVLVAKKELSSMKK